MNQSKKKGIPSLLSATYQQRTALLYSERDCPRSSESLRNIHIYIHIKSIFTLHSAHYPPILPPTHLPFFSKCVRIPGNPPTLHIKSTRLVSSSLTETKQVSPDRRTCMYRQQLLG